MSKLLVLGLVEPRAYGQLQTFAAGITFARTEGFIPAPETNHAIACVIEEAKRAKEEGKGKGNPHELQRPRVARSGFL